MGNEHADRRGFCWMTPMNIPLTSTDLTNIRIADRAVDQRPSADSPSELRAIAGSRGEGMGQQIRRQRSERCMRDGSYHDGDTRATSGRLRRRSQETEDALLKWQARERTSVISISARSGSCPPRFGCSEEKTDAANCDQLAVARSGTARNLRISPVGNRLPVVTSLDD